MHVAFVSLVTHLDNSTTSFNAPYKKLTPPTGYFTSNEWSLGWGPIEYNVSRGEWDYLFQKGNTTADNVGFLFKTGLTLYGHRKTLIATDKEKTLVGEALQITSRLTWELPQTLLGMFLYDFYSSFGSTKFEHKGISYLKSKLMGGGMTVGNYSIVNDPGSRDLQIHEFGHTVQSRIFGPLYLPLFAIPSFFRAGFMVIFGIRTPYLNFYTESWAEKLGKKYH